MSEIITGIQPNILQWARDRAGYSVSQVAERFQKRPQVIKDWEAGLAAPTYPQLEKLAALYKRPVALFFFPKPPEEPEVQQEFRSIPNSELEELEPTTRYLLRVAHAYQISLNELNDGKNPDPKKIFRDIQCPDFHDVAEVAQQIREYLAIDMETQTSWRTSDGALKSWREAVERVGVYVFKNSFRQKSISGFCLVDNEFPVIFLNNSTTKNRQIFTLFHELGTCGQK
jgi:transcriptional regulator with XRE-family HTH domain